MSTEAMPPRAADQGRGQAVLTVLLVAAAVVTSAVAALGALDGNKTLIVLPIMAAAGVGLGVLALTRFGFFVMVLLAVRASLDVARISGHAAGNTSTNTASTKGLDPSSLVGVLFLLVAVLWLAAQLRRSGTLGTSRFRTTLLVFLAASGLSVIGSANHQSSALELLRLAAVVVMFVVLEQLMTNRRMRDLLIAGCFASAVFPILFTAFGIASGHPNSEVKGGFTRLTGTFTQANDYGRYLMVLIIFGVAIYPYVQARTKQALGVILLGCAVCMLLSLTVTALIGTVIGLAVVGLIQSKRLLAGLAIGLIASVVFVPNVLSRVTSATTVSSVQSVGGNTNSSLSWRLAYWTEVLPLANSNPITGIGLNMTQYQTDAAKQPHNDFLRAYVETGIIGFVAYVALMISMLGLGRRARDASYAGTFDRGIAAGFWGVAVAFVLVSVAANVITNVALLWYVAAFAAAASSVIRISRNQERELMSVS